jgi:hypothetical protein
LPNSYVVDVFRVKGGTNPVYAFHGPPADEHSTNATNKQPAKRTEVAVLKDFDAEETLWTGTAPDQFVSSFRMRREKEKFREIEAQASEERVLGPNFDPNAPRKHLKVHLVGQAGSKVSGGRAYGQQVVFFTSDCVYIEPDFATKEAVFVAVYEPYSGESYIQSVKLLNPSNTKQFSSPIGIEIVLKNGRRDTVFVNPPATQTSQVTSLENDVKSNGEFAFATSGGQGTQVRGALVGGTVLEAPSVNIKQSLAAFKGKVSAIETATNSIVVDGPLPKEVVGTVLRTNQAAKEHSFTVTCSAGNKLTFNRGLELIATRINSVSADNSFKTTFPIPNSNNWLTVNDNPTGWRQIEGVKNPVGSAGAPPKLKADDIINVWRVGPGDDYRFPAWTVINSAGKTQGNVQATAVVTP